MFAAHESKRLSMPGIWEVIFLYTFKSKVHGDFPNENKPYYVLWSD